MVLLVDFLLANLPLQKSSNFSFWFSIICDFMMYGKKMLPYIDFEQVSKACLEVKAKGNQHSWYKVNCIKACTLTRLIESRGGR